MVVETFPLTRYILDTSTVFGTSLFQISKNKAAQTGLNKQAT
jgi:hypothetical protein